jgi:hypothetical protein
MTTSLADCHKQRLLRSSRLFASSGGRQAQWHRAIKSGMCVLLQSIWFFCWCFDVRSRRRRRYKSRQSESFSPHCQSDGMAPGDFPINRWRQERRLSPPRHQTAGAAAHDTTHRSHRRCRDLGLLGLPWKFQLCTSLCLEVGGVHRPKARHASKGLQWRSADAMREEVAAGD